MNENTLFALDVAQGPIFRAAFALMVLGIIRWLLLSGSDALAAYMAVPDRGEFWRKARMRQMWALFPSVVLRRARPGSMSAGMYAYHLVLCMLSLIVRLGFLIVPTFMVAHVYLWEGVLGVRWPALPGQITDVLAVITIVAGVLLLFGRLYSPMLRKLESPWSFLKPLVLIMPFLTGFLAMHPRWSPFGWHFLMLMHVLSACLAFVMIPFGRLLACMHVRLTDVLPEAAWFPSPEAAADAVEKLNQPDPGGATVSS